MSTAQQGNSGRVSTTSDDFIPAPTATPTDDTTQSSLFYIHSDEPSRLSLDAPAAACDTKALPDPGQASNDLPFTHYDFELSSENALFLEQLFGNPPKVISDTPRSTSCDYGDVVHVVETTNCAGNEAVHSFLQSINIDESIFDAALHAYFEYAARCIPLLFENAFWQDYHTGRSSQALIFAVACRGMPFTAFANKWHLQEQLALKYRTTFLEGQCAKDAHACTRIDDLEALALMVNFNFDSPGGSKVEDRLGSLYLTVDSLVLMTLQMEKNDKGQPGDDPQIALARAGERRVLLYWHVFGIDAFHSLDRKTISRNPDCDVDQETGHVQHLTGYLDAILALATIARSITKTICNTRSRKADNRVDAVQALYDQLYYWHIERCPDKFRWGRKQDVQSNHHDQEDKSPTANSLSALRLQRAVILSLEVNCLMQIEDCVTRIGVADAETIDEELIVLLVESNALRAVKMMMSLATFISATKFVGQSKRSYSLVDMAPTSCEIFVPVRAPGFVFAVRRS